MTEPDDGDYARRMRTERPANRALVGTVPLYVLIDALAYSWASWRLWYSQHTAASQRIVTFKPKNGVITVSMTHAMIQEEIIRRAKRSVEAEQEVWLRYQAALARYGVRELSEPVLAGDVWQLQNDGRLVRVW